MYNEDLSDPIKTKFSNCKANKNIYLGRQLIKLTIGKDEIITKGNVYLSLVRSPNIELVVKAKLNLAQHFELFANDGKVQVGIFPDVDWNIISNDPITAVANPKFLRFHTNSKLKSVTFNILNFEKIIGAAFKNGKSGFTFGRIVLIANGWALNIDQVNKLNIDTLNQVGGYGITHAARLERVNGDVFTTEDADSILKNIFYFLSFARGLWAPPVQLEGCNSKGKIVWKEWGFSKHTSPWKFVLSWFDGDVAQESLQGLFPGFLNLISNQTWQSVIERVIYWYIVSNNLGYIEGALILSQTALELLSWNYLVVDKQILSSDGHKKLTADDQIRLLLSSLDIPIQIPPELGELIQAAKEYNFIDGPQAVTHIRNSFIHPTKTKKKIGNDAVYQCAAISMWYIELAILRLCDYHGKYANRLKNMRFAGDVTPVPW